VQKIIDGTLFERHHTPYAHEIKVHDLGHGHIEASILPRYGWVDTGAVLTPQALADHAACLLEPLEPSVVAEKAREHRDRSTRRARTRVRRLCKAKGCNTMWTLTYRENMEDRERLARDFDVFLKRVRRLLPGFEYVAVGERQKRGAWHMHIACPRTASYYVINGRRVKSYDLLRSMWRGVVGRDNGNIDVSKNRKLRSAAKLAAYLSKYIGKTFDQAEKWVNAYSASNGGIRAPICVRVPWDPSSLSPVTDGIAALYALLDGEVGGSSVFTKFLDGGGFYMCLSPPDGGRVLE